MVTKLSQITQSGVGLTSADFLIGVTAGNLDRLFTPAQVVAAIAAVPFSTSLFSVTNNPAGSAALPGGSGFIQLTGADGGEPEVLVDAFGHKSILNLRRADNTLAAQTAVGSADTLGAILFSGYNGSSYNVAPGAQISANATETWVSNTNKGTELLFFITPTGTFTAVNALHLYASGGVSIGNSTFNLLATGNDPGSGTLNLQSGLLLSGGATALSGVKLVAAATSSPFTATLQAATDTLVGRATPDTLTNKTIAIASNTLTGVAPLASPSFTGTVTMPDTSTFASNFAVGGNAILTGPTAAKLQLGAADAAAPVAQTLGVQNVVAGTSNTAGALTTIDGSQGTGTGAGGGIQFKVAPAGSTGTAQNALVNSLYLAPTVASVSLNSVPQVAIGTTSPDASSTFVISANATAPPLAAAISHLHLVAKDSNFAGINYDTFASNSFLIFRRSEGTNGGQAATASGATIGLISARGWDTAYTGNRGVIAFTTAELWASGANGLQIDFSTTAKTTMTTQVNFRMQASGGLSVGNGVIATDPGAGGLIAGASIKSSGATAGIGYATGAGGTITQNTSKSTAVTLNTMCGQITMNNATLGGQSEVSFTLSNTAIAATDTVLVDIASGATANSYVVGVAAVAAGSCVIQLGNVTLATNLSEAVVLNFAVIKGVTS
jgi:hypothetical protein